MNAILILLLTATVAMAATTTFTLGWDASGEVDGFRLYLVDENGNVTQQGDDIVPGDRRTAQVTYRNGKYVFTITAFNQSAESEFSNLCYVKVNNGRAREQIK